MPNSRIFHKNMELLVLQNKGAVLTTLLPFNYILIYLHNYIST